MIKTIIIAATLAFGANASAQEFSLTPGLDKLELTSTIQFKPTLYNFQTNGRMVAWGSNGNVGSSFASAAICATLLAVALHSGKNGHPVAANCNSQTRPANPYAWRPHATDTDIAFDDSLGDQLRKQQ